MNQSVLTPEQALTRRWLREQWLPLEAWRWLAGQPAQPAMLREQRQPPWLPMLQSFLEPLAVHANQHQRQCLADSLRYMSSLFMIVAERGRGYGRCCHERMLAASLLPLYRGLAGGQLDEIIRVMRLHLAETMTLVALVDELGEDFGQLLTHGLARDEAPHELTRTQLELDLGRLSQLLLTCAGQWSGEFTQQPSELTENLPLCERRPAWGQPIILWRLAGQLLADHTEFMVPRDWIDIPVPWQQVSDHWRAIAHELQRHRTSQYHRQSANHRSTKLSSDSCLTTSTQATALSISDAAANHSAQAPFDTDVDGSVPTTRPLAVGSSLTSEMEPNDAGTIPDSLSLELDIADSVASLVVAAAEAVPMPDEIQLETSTSHDWDKELPLLKMVIAEVRSHNDPAFVAEVRRLLAVCRSEDRTVSLMTIRVQADGEADHTGLQKTAGVGLMVWQHQLIHWLVQHPEVRQPQAFISHAGELILCLLDIERNTATALLRQGIEESLTSKVTAGHAPAALPRITPPVHYHSGIASVSSPLASLSAEQFISATYRCMDAAERHGKACIKSIEVF